MNMNNLVRPLFIMMLVLGLAAGCASTPDESVAEESGAAQAIADAKSANARAKAMNAEWRDTGKVIKGAEAALAAGDDEKAIKQANKAKRQAQNAMQQSKAEQARLEASGALSGAGGGMAAAEDSSASRQGGMIAGDNQYEVNSGDNLWNISAQADIYANPYQWPLIYKANRDKIKDADLIYAGQVLDIDRDASASDMDAAISHAKSRGAWSVGATEASDEAYLAE